MARISHDEQTAAAFLGKVDTFRYADTTMRTLTDDEFRRGKERLRHAVRRAEPRQCQSSINRLMEPGSCSITKQ